MNGNPASFQLTRTLAAPRRSAGDWKRLVARHSGITVEYDCDGNRARKTVGGVTTYCLLDDRNPSGYVQVLAE